jgi:LCP family protein required for cell wall assembly
VKKQRAGKSVLYLCVILVLVLAIVYSGLRILESTVLHSGQDGENVASKTILRDGVEYFPRQDLTTVLLIGVDEFGPVKDSGFYTNTGAADVNILLVFDETNQVVNVLHLNRDTMVRMPVLGIGGKPAGTYYGQLALSHTYGSGLEDSCKNTVKTVSDFLYGIEIDYYVAMNMDVIAIMNDAVGGVTVNVTDDFSAIDPTIPVGEVTLQGQQATHFIRARNLGDKLKTSRMQRHKEYMAGFLTALDSAELETLLDAYEQASPYMVTDCSANALSGMLERFADFPLGEVVSPEGRNVLGETYYEFYVDEAALDDLILRLLYAPKK